MKLAVISDIHGNFKALEAFLEYLESHPADRILCLGDYVTDSPYPQRTMELLYEMCSRYRCVMIRGNREEYLLENSRRDQGWKRSSPSGALYYTAENLTRRDLAFFERMPLVEKLEPAGLPAITLCHGTPDEIRGNLEETPELKTEVMRKLDTPYLLGGHSHHQEQDTVLGKTYVNPGSLGLAIDGKGKCAQFAVLTGAKGRWETEFVSIPYDADSFLQDFTISRLDEYGMILNRAVKKTVASGINYFYLCIQEVQRRCPGPLSEIPEDIWQEAAVKLEI